MSLSKLIELSYFDGGSKIRLTAYADTVILENDGDNSTITAIRFGGYPEMVRAMSDAIYGGGTVEAVRNDVKRTLKSRPKGYRRQLAHDGVYATATLMANDDKITAEPADDGGDDDGGQGQQQELQPRKCYIFCPAGDRDCLFEEVDHKTAAPLIPEFRDYVLDGLTARGDLRQLEVISLREKLDAYVLKLKPEDANVVELLEDGLKSGAIAIPGAAPGQPDGFDGIENVTGYLNTFGPTVAQRIRSQSQPLFDPAAEPLSEEVLAVNDTIMAQAGYSLYDAQLAVAEATKRQLARKKIALIVAECGSGKTKIGATALGALQGMHSALKGRGKTFNLIMAPSHVTKKWVREIGETLPDTFAMVVKSITDLDRLYAAYQAGDKSVYAVFSKEKARDGYMRYPAVTYHRRTHSFRCPDCGEAVKMTISDDGTKYEVNADQFYFMKEHRGNHYCANCGTPLWSAINPGQTIPWAKITDYGWVYRPKAAQHRQKTKNERVLARLEEIEDNPDGYEPVRGACRRYALSTYIKKKYRGRIDGFLCDELHEYNNASGQGDAMGELFGVSRLFVSMTATLINGYSSGIFHLLYRLTPGLMRKDDKPYRKPAWFDEEYGVVENTYELLEGDYNSNRRTAKRKIRSKKLPGVSPLVYSRFLLEYTCFLSLSDMGKDLPDYEEIPVPLDMPEKVRKGYKQAEHILQKVLKTDQKVANKLLSAYLNLLTVYPDQPYDQPEIVHPINGEVIVKPANVASFEDILPKEEKTLEIVREKVAAGGRVLIYTSWTRTDSQQKLMKLLTQEGYRTEILSPAVPPDKREAWVDKRVRAGLQVLITNQRCVETGLDLNAFTTLIFYSMGFNLFTLRQASRRSWRINQDAPRVEVYLLYYADTMQAKAMKLMASKLAVAGIIEGTLSEEGLAAMSDVRDLTSQMAKELALGIKDNVEDIAAAFKKMAVINPERRVRTVAQPAAALPAQEAPTIKDASTRTRRKEFDGLLERTLAEQKKKKKPKKPVVDEDQFTLDGFAA